MMQIDDEEGESDLGMEARNLDKYWGALTHKAPDLANMLALSCAAIVTSQVIVFLGADLFRYSRKPKNDLRDPPNRRLVCRAFYHGGSGLLRLPNAAMRGT